MKLIDLTQFNPSNKTSRQVSVNPQYIMLLSPYENGKDQESDDPGQRIAPHTWVCFLSDETELLVLETRSEIKKLLELIR